MAVTRRRFEDEKPRRNGQGFVNLGGHAAQLRQTSRISLLESVRNSRTSYEMRGRRIIIRLIVSEDIY